MPEDELARGFQAEEPHGEINKERMHKKVLVVDDHPINQRLMVSMLDKLGYSADIAEDGSQAVDLAAQNCYEYIFMDLQMPVMDGLTATARIRAGSSLSAEKTVIIAMTANVMEGIQTRCKAAGMDGYISKPLKLSSIKQIISRHEVHDSTLIERNASLF